MNTDEIRIFIRVQPRPKYVCTPCGLTAFDPLAFPASQPLNQTPHATRHPALSGGSDRAGESTSRRLISSCDRSIATDCNHYSTPQNLLHSTIPLPAICRA